MRPNPVTFLAATCITLAPAFFACDQGEDEDSVAPEPQKTIELMVSPLPVDGGCRGRRQLTTLPEGEPQTLAPARYAYVDLSVTLNRLSPVRPPREHADACYAFQIMGPDGALVDEQNPICSSSYGDSRRSINFVDVCDTGPTGRAQNVARLQLIALCDADGNALPIAGLPCTDTFCTRKFDCTRDGDAAVPFTLGTRQTPR